MSGLVGLHLGPSFMSFPGQPHLPIQAVSGVNAAQALRKLQTHFSENAQFQLNGLFFEKFLASTMGGKVCQLVTKGARTTLGASPFANEQSFVLEIEERISANGNVLAPLTTEALAQALQQMKERKIERVCLQFLHQNRNATHTQMAETFFREQGMTVFSCLDEMSQGFETARFRQNLVQACLAGSFYDLRNELESLFGTRVELGFRNATEASTAYWSDLAERFLQQAKAKKMEAPEWILHLGLEKWALLNTRKQTSTWQLNGQEVWGKGPLVKELSIQPTTGLACNRFSILEFSQAPLGFEPGPVSFGRSLRLSVFDFLPTPQCEWITASGLQKRDQQVDLLRKGLSSGFGMDLNSMKKAVLASVVRSLRSEIATRLFSSASTSKLGPIGLSGFFAKTVAPLLTEKSLEVSTSSPSLEAEIQLPGVRFAEPMEDLV